jgi:hypothetical protein
MQFFYKVLCVFKVLIIVSIFINGISPLSRLCEKPRSKPFLIGGYRPQCDGPRIYKAEQFSPVGIGWCVTEDGFKIATIDVKEKNQPPINCLLERANFLPIHYVWWHVAFLRFVYRINPFLKED